MARSTYIYMVWAPDSGADCGNRLFGAFTVKHEMYTAIDRAKLDPVMLTIERVRDGQPLREETSWR